MSVAQKVLVWGLVLLCSGTFPASSLAVSFASGTVSSSVDNTLPNDSFESFVEETNVSSSVLSPSPSTSFGMETPEPVDTIMFPSSTVSSSEAVVPNVGPSSTVSSTEIFVSSSTVSSSTTSSSTVSSSEKWDSDFSHVPVGTTTVSSSGFQSGINDQLQKILLLPFPVTTSPPGHYLDLMRSFSSSRPSSSALKAFVSEQQEVVQNFDVSKAKKAAYLKRLSRQLDGEKTQNKNFLQDLSDTMRTWWDDSSSEVEAPMEETDLLPTAPARFWFAPKNIPVQRLPRLLERWNIKEQANNMLKTFLGVQKVYALDTSEALPILEDLLPSEEVVITEEMKMLVKDLEFDPVQIVNFVRERVVYEAYFGAKKGSAGCFLDFVCNDVDSSSLLIALLRAAGIPARYEQSLSVFSVHQLQNMLGVEDTKSVYAALSLNGVPVYVVSENEVGENFEAADFSRETHLAVLWTHAELFFSQNFFGEDILLGKPFISVSSTEDVHAQIQSSGGQWFPTDVLVKNYELDKKDVLHDQVLFDTQNFWDTYLQTPSELSPVDTYFSQIAEQSGEVPEEFYSSRRVHVNGLSSLPLTLPYERIKDASGIPSKTFSSVPNDLRPQVRISVVSKDDETVFEKTFFSSQIENIPINLKYRANTEEDQAVLEHFGGIALTPAELVDVVPVLQVGMEIFEGENIPVQIGDRLVLRFELIQAGEVLHTDEKYSLAGNEEGIYLTLSEVREQPQLDTSERVQREGNAGIAWQYLKQLQTDTNRIAASLDYGYNLHFARAVVTQNRVLSEFEGVPTTFDFDGMTIDTSVYIMDYSRRGDFDTHQKDFRLLLGLQESFLEADVLKRVTGLESMATVQGIQYAATNDLYRVKYIDQETIDIIDILPFSLETREYMRRAVESGSTVITPDQPIQKGNFFGVLYIVLDPDGTATYAIGEQVLHNGAWTVDALQLTQWNEQNQIPDFAYELVTNGRHIIYKENMDKSIRCNIAVERFDRIVAGLEAPGWDLASHGLPCFDDTPNDPYYFGNRDHRFLVATNGAFFSSEAGGYSYWAREQEIVGLLQEAFHEERFTSEQVYPYWGTFTYAKGSPNWNHQKKIAALGVFVPNIRSVQKIKEDFAQKYVSSKKIVDQYVPALLGYPQGPMVPAASSLSETRGMYQNFTNGQIYERDGDVFVTFGQISEFLNREEHCRTVEVNEGDTYVACGSGGLFGFPVKDPKRKDQGVEQEFEEGTLLESETSVQMFSQSEESRRLQNKEYAEKQLKKVLKGELTDLEAFANIVDYIAPRARDDEQFVADVTVVFTGAETMIGYWNKLHGLKAHSRFEVDNFSDTGFKFLYNDSHYCMDDFHNCISNQILHSMLGFNHAYFFGKLEADYWTLEHDASASPLGYNTQSLEDIWLGHKVSIVGEKLRNGEILRSEVGNWIRENLGERANLESSRISRPEIVSQAPFRVKFRAFEYQNGGHAFDQWMYKEDMKKISCDGKQFFSQNYLYFTTGGENLGKTKIVWNDDAKKMVILSGQNYHIYNQSENRLCQDMDQLTEDQGVTLLMNLSEVATFIYKSL